MIIKYRPQGVCSSLITMDIEDGIVQDVTFTGGCAGNATGISALVKGMKVQDVIARLEGIKCGWKSTSCPAQLAKALAEAEIE